ncbi:CPBP family intramembrane glutamic endopeptidase [Pradoshia sp.]
MNHTFKDRPFLLSLSLAYLLLFVSYSNLSYFWYLYTFSMTCLMIPAIYYEQARGRLKLKEALSYGLVSGIFMYMVTWTASKVLPALFPPLQNQLENLYALLFPTEIWQYAALTLLIIPGEEVFWRGFIQRRLHLHTKNTQAVLLSTMLYSLPLTFSGNLLLVLAGIGGGLLWGFIYAWKRSLSMVIISHLLFDLLLLFVFPLVDL